MHFADLSPYTYATNSRRPLVDEAPQSLNIGWLATEYPYTQGDVADDFMARLWTFCHTPVNLMRGFHECDLCADPTLAYLKAHRGGEEIGMGNGEIWVFGDDGKVYVAPTLIYHYIAQHHYQPPKQFIRAVLAAPLPDTPAYDLQAAQFQWGQNMLRWKAAELRHQARQRDSSAR